MSAEEGSPEGARPAERRVPITHYAGVPRGLQWGEIPLPAARDPLQQVTTGHSYRHRHVLHGEYVVVNRHAEDGNSQDGRPMEMELLQMRQIFHLPQEAGIARLPRIFLAPSPLFEESFCKCNKDRKTRELSCMCGESDSHFDWVWDSESKSSATQLRNENREVRFHMDYSCGTAAVRGNQPMLGNQYYWEIKMTTPVYGTDMMVGVGTNEADLDGHRDNFCSLLGSDCESWGLSYTGLFYHQGKARCYAPRFGQGSIIGIHLDMWNGTLSFYKNRHSLGVACRGLKGKTLYPMVSSTAARSGMKVIRSRSFSSSLQYLCCLKLRQLIPPDQSVLDVVHLPPGLSLFLQNNLGWLLGPTTSTSGGCCCQCQCSKQQSLKKSNGYASDFLGDNAGATEMSDTSPAKWRGSSVGAVNHYRESSSEDQGCEMSQRDAASAREDGAVSDPVNSESNVSPPLSNSDNRSSCQSAKRKHSSSSSDESQASDKEEGEQDSEQQQPCKLSQKWYFDKDPF